MSDKVELLRNLKILYVEDECEHREQLYLFLKRRVGKLITAANGEEGLKAFLEHAPDIVITDLKMPEMNGVEMSAQIREYNKFCPIIITTAFSDLDTILQVVDKGIDKYIIKPIDTDELLEALESCVMKVVEGREEEFVTGYDLQCKKEYENKILKELAHYIKINSGKGPRYVKVKISNNRIEVEVKDPFTTFEKKLLENRKNTRLISFCRDAFYMDSKNALEKLIEDIVNIDCSLETVETDFNNSRDILVFAYKIL